MDTATEITVADRVAKGLAWIDEWAERLDLDLNRVNLETINVVNDRTCVVAQASGGAGFMAIMDKTERLGGRFMLVADYGFAGHHAEDEAELTAEWRRVILARRAGTTT
jgi:hypothetical protein